jgi:fused signal recognition particle receptor
MGIFDKLKNIVSKKENTNKYDEGLSKSRKKFTDSFTLLNNKHKKITDEYLEELEELLIMADVGVNAVMKLMELLIQRIKSEKIENTEDLKEIIVDELFITYVGGDILESKIKESESGPTVILFVGVNGVGKTTTIGKIANKYTSNNKKVLLVAGDTFRAGAREQITEWAKRSSSEIIQNQSADPSAVIYDALIKAKEENIDYVLIDTAGRLQNKVNLMKELEKINKVIGKHIPEAPHETMLVLDATTGQNGISQAKEFKEVTNITGIVLSKLDSTAKGGIVLAIKEETNIPVKFVGLGEGIEDLIPFDIENYIYGLFRGDANER